MKSQRVSRSGWVWLTALLVVSGCNVVPPVQPDLTRYYVLSGSSLPGGTSSTETAARTLHIGLRLVEVAPYLRRNSMVVREGEHELSFADNARWAEPLDREITSVLRQRIAAAPGVARVLVPPFPLEPARDFDVAIHVLQCEGRRGNGGRAGVSFAATIEITSAREEGRVLARKTFVASEAAWDGRDFSKLAALLSDAAAALGQEVVATLPPKT